MFDTVIMAVAINNDKKPMFSNKTRIKMIEEVTKDIDNIKVDCFSGLLVNYAKKQNENTDSNFHIFCDERFAGLAGRL